MPSDRASRPAGRAKGFRTGTVRSAALFLMAVTALAAGPASLHGLAPGEASTYEYEVKAVFLYHFTRYLQWPEQDTADHFEIAVLGESAIAAPLAEIAAKRTVSQRPIRIRTINRVEALGRPQILFVAKPAAPLLRRILEETREKAILTVGEEEGLAGLGLAMNFVVREGAVKFEVNEGVLRAGGIQPSAQLLKLAIPAGGPAAEGPASGDGR